MPSASWKFRPTEHAGDDDRPAGGLCVAGRRLRLGDAPPGTGAAHPRIPAMTAMESLVPPLVKWAPLMFQGFIVNILISLAAMAVGTVAGTLLGVAQVSPSGAVRRAVRAVRCRVTPLVSACLVHHRPATV